MASGNEELEGITFKVYLYVARENHPVGTRDVIRNLGLSSSSVAFRHLQKLEALGLLQKNDYGEYTLKEKAGIQGHVWIGRNLVPRLLIYSLFFLGLLAAEVSIIFILFFVNNQFPNTNFVYLTAVTAIAMVVLLMEGLLFSQKMRRNSHSPN